MRQKAPLLKPPSLRKFHLKFAHHCMAFCFLHNDPPWPPGCTTSWLYPHVAQISFEICTMTPPWTPSTAQDPCSPILTRSCRMRKIHGHPLRKIHVPPHCPRSMSSHCAISMSPNYGRSMSPLKHAQYILRSMEADHCRVLPTGRGKHGTQLSTMELNMKTQTHTS